MLRIMTTKGSFAFIGLGINMPRIMKLGVSEVGYLHGKILVKKYVCWFDVAMYDL